MMNKVLLLLIGFLCTTCYSKAPKKIKLNEYEKILVGVWIHDFDDIWNILSEKDKEILQTKYGNILIYYNEDKTYLIKNNNKVISEGEWEVVKNKSLPIMLYRRAKNEEKCFKITHLLINKMILISCNEIAHEKLKKI